MQSRQYFISAAVPLTFWDKKMENSSWNPRLFWREIGEALYGLLMTSAILAVFIFFPVAFIVKLGWLAGGASVVAWYLGIWFIKKYYPSGWL